MQTAKGTQEVPVQHDIAATNTELCKDTQGERSDWEQRAAVSQNKHKLGDGKWSANRGHISMQINIRDAVKSANLLKSRW
jgi:hypothetical protein